MVALERLLQRHELRQRLELRVDLVGALDLVLELADDERRAPPQDVLRDVHVAEDVVAHVEDLVPRQPEELLDDGGAAAVIGLALVEGADHGLEQAVGAGHLEEREARREEGWLVGGDDHDVEQIAPGLAGRHEAIERVAHHRDREGPLGVGDQQQLLARVPLVEQREGAVRVELHEALGVGHDLGLELPLHVGEIDVAPRELVDLAVRVDHRQLAGVEQVDELREHVGLREREQGVEEHPARLR